MRALWLVPALALTLTGCGGEPLDVLRGDVEAVTLAANDRSAEGVRDAVEDLLATIREQVGSRELDRAEGDRLRTIALRIAERAALLEDAVPSPAPTVAQEEEPSPEPSPEPEPEPEPEHTEEEEPEPEPTEEEEPEPEPTLEVVIPPVEESPPPAQSQGGGSPSAAPTPAA